MVVERRPYTKWYEACGHQPAIVGSGFRLLGVSSYVPSWGKIMSTTREACGGRWRAILRHTRLASSGAEFEQLSPVELANGPSRWRYAWVHRQTTAWRIVFMLVAPWFIANYALAAKLLPAIAV